MLEQLIIVWIISFFFASGWFFLITQITGIKSNWKLFWIHNTFFYLIQILYNMILIFLVDKESKILDYFYYIEAINFFFQMIITISLFYYKEKRSFFKIASAVCLSYFFCFNFFYAIEYFIYEFIKVVVGTDVIKLSALKQNLLTIVVHFILFIYAFCLSQLLKKIRFSEFFSKIFVSNKNGIISFIISVILTQSYRFPQNINPDFEDSITYPIFSLFTLFLTILIFLVIAIWRLNKDKLETQEMIILQQNNYVESLESLQQEMRFLKHDYQNVLSGLYLQASEGDLSAIRDYLGDTLKYFNEKIGIELKQTTQLSKIQVIEIKSLMIGKCKEFKEKNIKIELEVLYPIKEIYINKNDFIRCLGILLDNAKEAVLNLESAFINIIFLDEENKLTITIENPTDTTPEIHNIFKKGYSTKGKNRGIGLASYKQILKDYKNTFTKTNCRDGVFLQELIIRKEL